MLIDATHSEETRVVVLENGRLEELDVDTSTKKQIKGNIYLAKIVRVEPSLQAAFVDYGGNKHGFLAFGEIHPDYYQIPVADREALKELMETRREDENEPIEENTSDSSKQKPSDVEVISEAETEDASRQRPSFLKKYKIQEVIRQGQVMLVQVVKEERGNKGAALTTYLSLAGRFSVLMPNNGKGGGVSRKITNVKDRKSLRAIVEKFPIPQGMSVIIRTAGQGKTKTEIKRDYDYLIKTWMKIREETLESLAPKLIHEEGDIIKRSLRDVFTPDIEEIWVEGESVFKSTRDFMKMLMPSQAKKIKQYKGIEPLFLANQVEQQLETIHNNIIQLKSGGYLVIDQTEALVAVDVNSGRATREHDIEETALRTNLETCEELARQLRLRDMAGLIVIDFIDMDEPKNNAAVERKLKESLKKDRARIQVGKMSGFGLIEMSRQRLHSSFLESSYQPCPHCGGKGITRSIESCAMHALHILEEAAFKNSGNRILISLPLSVATYLLNNKRSNLVALETKYESVIQILPDENLMKSSDFKLERIREDGERININLSNHNRQDNTKDKKRNENRQKKPEEKEIEKQNTAKTKESKPLKENEQNAVEKREEPNEGETIEQQNTEARTDKKSRNNRRRNDWRRKRREKKMLARQQQLENTEEIEIEEKSSDEKPLLIGEEKFTIVEQEPISAYHIHEKEVLFEEKLPQKTNSRASTGRKGQKKGKPESELKTEGNSQNEQSEEKQSSKHMEKPANKKTLPKVSSEEETLKISEKQTTFSNETVQHSPVKETGTEKPMDETTLNTDGQEIIVKKQKRGWWNKLVKSE